MLSLVMSGSFGDLNSVHMMSGLIPMGSTRSGSSEAMAIAMAVSGFWFLLFLVSMESHLEQRVAIKMCVRAGETVKDTIQKLRAAWGGDSLGVTQIRFWFRRFQQEPDRHTKDQKHTGRRVSKWTQKTLEAVQRKLDEDRQATVRQVAASCDIGKTTAHKILRKDLSLTKLAPKFVPRVLTAAQRQTRLTLCRGNVEQLEQDPGILARLIATDESWVFTYDPRTKFADMEWTKPGEPRPCKALRGHSHRKTMLILYFDSTGPLLTFFHDDGTVDSDIYMQSIREMREAVRRKRPALWAAKNFLLLQDNTSPHTSVPTLAVFYEVGIAESLWPHPQYSPDLSPCDYWAFPMLKAKIRGHHFENLDDVKTTVRRTLRATPVSEFQDCFDKLLIRYKKCIAAGGHYFEGQGKHGLPAPQED